MTLGLYTAGDSWLHRLFPITKLIFSLSAIAIIFGGPNKWLSAILPGVISILILWSAGIAWRALKLIVQLLTPIAVILFIVHGFFGPANHQILMRLGPFVLGQEGLMYASLIVVRLVSTLASSLLLVTSTHPGSLIQALEQTGLSRKLVYLLGSPLLLLPQMARRIQTIRSAQQSRGLETQGNLLQRIKALFPLVAPLVFSALVDVEERSLALEVRGFSAPTPKTNLTEIPDTTKQQVLRWGMIVIAVCFLVFEFWRKRNGYD
ncbi:MAG: cobalt transporter [Anaerolineaceae bacterium]|nr:cobalt transporter [Anaerolineaceae bacterium]